MNISILCPTRGRPKVFRQSMEMLWDNAKWPDEVEVVFRVDNDDPAKDDYFDVLRAFNLKDRQGKLILGPRLDGYASNHIFIEQCAENSTGAILIQYSDDAHVKTKHWDEKYCINVLNELTTGCPPVMIAKVHGEGDYPFSFPAITRKLYEWCQCFCLGQNPSVDRCWEAFCRHMGNCAVDVGVEFDHGHIKTVVHDKTSNEGRHPFCSELAKNWPTRHAEHDRIGKHYAEIVKACMTQAVQL